MSSVLFHWLKKKKMVFGKMDHLKRPIEIEILGLKKSNKITNSSLCGWLVCYVLGIFFMGWGNKI